MAEIEAAKLAQGKSQNEQVKTFAQQMIDDHSKALAEVQQLATAKGLTMPAEVDKKHKAMADKLGAKSGDAFDKAYMAQCGVAEHKKMHSMLASAEKKARDPDVKALLAQIAPTVDQHLKAAQQMGSSQGRGERREAAGRPPRPASRLELMGCNGKVALQWPFHACHPGRHLPVFRTGTVRLPGRPARHAAATGHSRPEQFRAVFRAAVPAVPLRLDHAAGAACSTCACSAVYLLCALLHGRPDARRSPARGGLDWNNAAFGALVAAFPNTGFMGVPLLVALMGPASSGPVIVTHGGRPGDHLVAVHRAVAPRQRRRAGQRARLARRAARHARANPMPWAIALGALASGAGLVLPEPLMQTIAPAGRRRLAGGAVYDRRGAGALAAAGGASRRRCATWCRSRWPSCCCIRC